MIKSISRDFLHFVKKPNDAQLKLNLKQKIFFFLFFFSFELLLNFIIIFPIQKFMYNSLELKTSRFSYTHSFINAFFMMVIIVPFVEEMLFRYLLRRKGFLKKIAEKKWSKIFPYLVYSLCIAFSLIHLSNYADSNSLIYLFSPLIILTQLIGGFVITFIRVRLNFTWGLLYHWTWNLFFVVGIPVFNFHYYQPYTEKTNNYKIEIQHKPFFERRKPQSFEIDSVKNKIYRIETKQYSMQHIIDTLYGKEQFYVDDELINMKLKSKVGIEKDSLISILKKEYKIRKTAPNKGFPKAGLKFFD